MKTTTAAQAFTTARAASGKTTRQTHAKCGMVTRIEQGKLTPLVTNYAAILARVDAKLIVETATGERILIKP
jgi:hypothetical protein